jgi:integrase
VNAARRERIDYDQFIEDTKQARRLLNLTRPHRGRTLPNIPTEDSVKRFFAVIDRATNLSHQVMLRLMLFTGVRVAELVHIEVADVDLTGTRIFIRQGKGAKDRVVLFPAQFRLALQSHIRTNPDNKYLFESRRKTKYTTRQIRNIVKDYGDAAGIDRMHPHLLRHLCLTFLTQQGLSDSEIQLVSGHSSKASLEIYQHLSLKDVSGKYQDAMKKMELE